MALTQSHYRFGIDSGTESSHGWHANEDANPSEGTIALDTTFLLRFCLQCDGTAASNVDCEYQYRVNGGTWTNITTTSSFVRAVAATALTNGGNCTKRLSGTGTFESSGAGQTEDGTSGGTANDIVANGNSECECGLQLRSADLTGGETVDFRLTRDGGVLIDTYAVTPSLTIPAAAANIDPSLITATTSVPSPTIVSLVDPGVITSTTSVPSPTIVSLVDPGVIASTTSVPNPTVDPSVVSGFITATTSAPSPTIGLYVEPGVIASTASVPNPTVSVGVGVEPGIIASTTTVPSPSVDPSVGPGAIAATTAVPNPTVDPSVVPEAIASTTSVPSPSADPSLLAVFLAAASAVFAPTLDPSMGASRIESTATVPNPFVDPSVGPGVIATTASVPLPTIDPSVAPGLITATTSVPNPTVDVGTTIDAVRIESTSSVFAFAVSYTVSPGFFGGATLYAPYVDAGLPGGPFTCVCWAPSREAQVTGKLRKATFS